MIIITADQLGQFVAELRLLWPQSLQIYKHAENYLQQNNFAWPGLRFIVDKFPDFNACILGPDPSHPNRIPRRDYWTYNAVARDILAFRELLQTPGVIDWTKASYFAGLAFELHVPLEEVCRAHGSTIGPDDRQDFSARGILIHTADVKPASLLSKEFSLRPFDVADIEKVNGKWLFSGTPSGLAYLTYLHSHGFPTMAAYTTQSNQLIGFLICNSEMNLAAAYVDPDYRGRHLFHSMAFEWCQEMAALGQTLTFAFVSEQNLASLKSLERLGGEDVDGWRVSYVLFLPKKCEPEDPLLLWYQRINQLKPIKSSQT